MPRTPTHYRHTLVGARVDIHSSNNPRNHTIEVCYLCGRALWVGPLQRTMAVEMNLRNRSWAFECMECAVARCKAQGDE
jgi:hypothetical protein